MQVTDKLDHKQFTGGIWHILDVINATHQCGEHPSTQRGQRQTSGVRKLKSACDCFRMTTSIGHRNPIAGCPHVVAVTLRKASIPQPFSMRILKADGDFSLTAFFLRDSALFPPPTNRCTWQSHQVSALALCIKNFCCRRLQCTWYRLPDVTFVLDFHHYDCRGVFLFLFSMPDSNVVLIDFFLGKSNAGFVACWFVVFSVMFLSISQAKQEATFSNGFGTASCASSV